MADNEFGKKFRQKSKASRGGDAKDSVLLLEVMIDGYNDMLAAYNVMSPDN